jgi:protein SCO1/2
MNLSNWITGAALMAGFAMAPTAAWSHDGHVHGGADQKTEVRGTTLQLPDTVLTDQDGRQVKLLSDVVADKLVVVNFMYTSCTSVCSMVSHTISELQDKLGPMLETRVRLVTLTVDPAHDTPATLKAYSAKHEARPGWLWLTGQPANVTEALKGFGAYTANFENHPLVALVGDGRTGKWTRVYDVDSPQRLIATMRSYLAAREQEKHSVLR